MRTRSSSNLVGESSHNPTTSNPKRRNHRRSKQPLSLEESPLDTMADQRTMAELLCAPTEGYAEAIVVPPILAEHFELKHCLINMMTSDQFFGLEKDNPHDHIRWFNKLTSTIKYKDVPNLAIKLMLFPFSLMGAARRWLEKESPRSTITWEDLAWDRYKDLLYSYPRHGFIKLHQLDTFYNALNPVDQDSLNSAVSGNLLERCTQDVLTIIENKSKQTSAVTTAMTAILKQFQATPPTASVKAIEEICVTCGGAHPYYQCSGSLPGNTIANPKGKLKDITTQSVLVLDRPSVPMPPPFINPEEDEHAEETLTNPELAEYTIKVPPPLVQKSKPLSLRNYVMLKDLLSNKEKLLELVNTPLNENCTAIILKKLPEKLGDSKKFLIPCGFSELKCKALADSGASINLMPALVWKKLGLPELISTRMTLELANQAICTPAGIARDVFVPVGKFTFNVDFVIIDYESDPPVPFILGRPFLQTAHALTNVHEEEMILRDEVINPLSGNTTSSSPDHFLKKFANELALITFPPENDDLLFDIESNLREIEYLLSHDPTKEMDSILEDSVDEDNLADPNNDLVDTILEMFIDEHTHDYSSLPLYDDVDDDLVELEFDNDDVYDDRFDSKEYKIKESKLLIDELDPPKSSDFLPSSITIRVTLDNNVKKIFISNASLILEDFNSPLYKLPFHKEVLGSKTLLSFSFENEKKVFNPRILTSKGVHTSLLSELSHRGPKAFKVIKNFEIPMEIFPCSYGEDIRILDVSCLHFYPPLITQFRGRVKLSDLKQALHGWKPMLILNIFIVVVMNKCVVRRLSSSIFCVLCFVLYVQDFLDFEDSCSWFCPSITRSSHSQLHFGNLIS
uniref:DNA-directed DNA polymerase n=1 Tax=Tanacetum cinerariifolium TaxID=118510 RepID=A0A6L2KUX2_TANCI|nr:DNA-directed DNA polymerase [Tanacetum cinerariifolium]